MSEEVSSQPVKEATPANPSKPKPVKRQADPTKPKITRSVKKRIELSLRKVKGIVGHIRNVQDNCLALGEKLIERGEIDLGKRLIANGLSHDISKFYGIEWENMAPVEMPAQEANAKLKLKLAIHHHQVINPHHVEHWVGGITQMPILYLAELVCDLKSRSEEFGTSVKDYIEDQCVHKWNITKDSQTYRQIFDFLDLLCEKPFSKI